MVVPNVLNPEAHTGTVQASLPGPDTVTVFYWLCAFLLDLKLGDPHHWPHPVIWIGKLISASERRLLKADAAPQQQRLAGLVLWCWVVGLSVLVCLGVLFLAAALHPLLAVLVQVVIAYQLLATRSLADAAHQVLNALNSGSLADSREKLSWIVGRDTSQLDETAIARATVETVAENTVDGVIAPLFWLFIGGIPAMVAYKAVNTLDSMVGYKNDKYRHFGFVSARLDDLANWLPARLSLLFFAIAALLLKLNWQQALRIGWRDRRNHKSPNCAWSEAAVAGALGMRMGGPNVYFGEVVDKPWIGGEGRDATPQDIQLSVQLMYAAAAISFGCFAAVSLMF